MTEQKLEAIITAKLAALGFGCIQSTFRTVASGSVLDEDGAAECVVTIDTGTRSQAYWEIGQFDFPFTVTMAQRMETDANGAKFLANASKVSALLCSYATRSGATALSSDFTITGEFTPAFFHLDGGANSIDRDESVATFEQSFTIRGIVK